MACENAGCPSPPAERGTGGGGGGGGAFVVLHAVEATRPGLGARRSVVA